VISGAKNRDGIRIGAWWLVVALLPAASVRAGDGAANVPTASDPSSTASAAPEPARPRIPPPRIWTQPAARPAAQDDTAPRDGDPAEDASSAAPVDPEPARPKIPPPRVWTQAAATPAVPEETAPREDAATEDGSSAAPVEVAPSAASTPAIQLGEVDGGSPARPRGASIAEALGDVSGPEAPRTDLPKIKAGEKDRVSPSMPRGASTAEVLGDLSDPEAARPDALKVKADSQVAQVGCATCGGFHSAGDGPMFHEAMGCANGQCIPGRKPCYVPCHDCDTVIGAWCQNLYQCLCCPDPCYEPRWVPTAYASFFADYARPRTVTRIRYDNLEAMTRPDRNQFWINSVTPLRKNGRPIINPYARLQQVYLYQEAAGERGSFFIEYPYRQINQSYAPTQAGFSDLNFGIKSLLFDCELLQVAFQFRTYTPTGNAGLNLGTGNFSLDPSILTSLKLGPETYFQGQFGNWVPLAGKQFLAGGVFYWLMSINHTLYYCTPDSPLIATLEFDGWSFENGGYTAAVLPGKNPVFAEKGGGVSYFNIGPGLRQSICNRLDFGGAITWATTSVHWAQPWFRFEARFLF
jgi:hypothetical protein